MPSYRGVGVSRRDRKHSVRYGGCDHATGQASFEADKAAAAKVLGAAGLGLSLASSASVSTTPTAGIPQSDDTSPNQRFFLGEEEMADVSLATFHLSKACRLVGAFGRSRISFAVSPSGWRSSRKTFEGVAGGSKTW